MSRTRKSKIGKRPGYEVDRKREGKRGWRSPGATAKRIGVRAQRRIGKIDCRGEPHDSIAPHPCPPRDGTETT